MNTPIQETLKPIPFLKRILLKLVEYSEKESTTILKVLEESKKDYYSRTF